MLINYSNGRPGHAKKQPLGSHRRNYAYGHAAAGYFPGYIRRKFRNCLSNFMHLFFGVKFDENFYIDFVAGTS